MNYPLMAKSLDIKRCIRFRFSSILQKFYSLYSYQISIPIQVFRSLVGIFNSFSLNGKIDCTAKYAVQIVYKI